MKKNLPMLLAALAASTLLAGCVVPQTDSAALFDLGPLRAAQHKALPALAPLSVAEISVPTWLDRPLIFFRLAYANDQQPRPYAQSRWAAPPAQLITQRLKSRIAHAGGVALSAADGATGVPVLRIELDDFTQVYTSPRHSNGQVGLRASLFSGRTLVAQKTFASQVPAVSADAAGGVRALAAASDAVIADMIVWLAMLDPK